MPRRIIKPFEDFIKHEAAGGIVLLFAAVIAVVLANSPLAAKFEQVLNYSLTLGFGKLALSKSLLHWVNDGLMAVFFFVIGMEIKRELVIGELQSVKKAALPIGAAIGGMIVPAAIYFFFNYGTAYMSGWGIPVATDIAFAMGAISLVGSQKAPKGIAVFLVALAIVDDLGAVLLIAIFYTKQISWTALCIALGILLTLILVNRLQKNAVSVFIALGFLLWLALLKSGIHPTIAGVLLGMTIPVHSSEECCERPMLCRLEHALQHWVAFVIMPVFALANAGVNIDLRSFRELFANPVSLGIFAGLFCGKQIGVFGVSYLMIRSGLTVLPRYTTFRHLYAVSLLAGIGFTMSMFIANLAFQDNTLLTTAKTSIIMASLLSAIAGLLIFSLQGAKKKEDSKERITVSEG